MKTKILNCGIYKIENLINGKIYIGQAANLIRRKTRHFSELRRGVHDNVHLQRSFDKYGEENFIFKIILYCEINELTYYEQSLVDWLKPEYNIRLECVDSNLGIKLSEETIKKRSISQSGENNVNYGKHLPEETRKKISIATSGENNHNFGKKFSEDHKRKISESLKGENHPMFGKHLSEEHKKKMSESTSGEKNFMFGKHHSEETNKRISESKKGFKHTEETKQKMREAQKKRREREKKDKDETNK